jgi:N-methylhydantoinase A
VAFRVGIDIGGTFTDIALYNDETQRVLAFKTLTSADPVECLSRGLDKAADAVGIPLAQLLGAVSPAFCFGSTIGVNTLLTHSGSRVGIVTTRGHGDAYHMFQKERLGHRDLRVAIEQVFQPLVERRHVIEVNERVDCFGDVVVPLDHREAEAAIRRLVENDGVEALVISFLWAHRNTDHEQAAKRIAQDLYPSLFVSVGSELVGAPGEFQRTATAVINAYIGNRVAHQANRVREYLHGNGLRAPILVMQNLGGLAPLEDVVRRPAYLLKSGPAGGVTGGARVAQSLDESNVVGIDMGGTSLDVSLMRDGEVELSSGFRILAHPLVIPGVEIDSVGAGGGSIASVHGAGRIASLKVGPESAGSHPGPACYGLGGELPTVTDADLVLGIIDPQAKLGGEIPLDAGRAQGAIDEHVARRLGISTLEAAWGIYQVITAQMADALELFLVKRGLVPSQFSLMVFGAAGAMHASAIARRLGIRQTIIPDLFPVLSAAGLMTSDIRYVARVAADGLRIAATAPPTEMDGIALEVSERFRRAADQPLALLRESDQNGNERRVDLGLGLRFVGQSLDLSVGVRDDVLDRPLTGVELREIVSSWLGRYARIYGEGAAMEDGLIEVAHYTAAGGAALAAPPSFSTAALGGSPPPSATNEAIGSRRLFLGREIEAAIFDESTLSGGMTLLGPAIVQGPLRTVLLWPGDTASVDIARNLTVSHGQH